MLVIAIGLTSLIYSVLIIWSISLHVLALYDTNWNYWLNVLNSGLFFINFIIAMYGFITIANIYTVGKEFLSIGFGQLVFSIGLAIWSFYNIVLHVDVPYPSFSDLAFVMFIPFTAYGVINLLRVFGASITKRYIFESAMLFLIAISLIFTFINAPDISADLSLAENILNLYYPFVDAFLISLGYLIIRTSRGKIHKSFILLLGGLLSMNIADLLFSYRTSRGIYWNGDISDIMFATSGFMFSLSIIYIIYSQSKIENAPVKDKNNTDLNP